MKKPIKLFDPHVGKDEEKIVQKVLKSKFWASGAGTGYVKKFENSFKKYVGSKECVAVNSGTAALNLSLSLIDIKNKEVILPSLTFVATANAVIENGGKPVFVDVDPQTMCIDPHSIRKAITSKTKVILPVHFGGTPSSLTEIQQICNEYNFHLIEDAAHAAGASYHGKKIGRHGFAVCFSFHPIKNLAMPTGGLISINDTNKNLGNILRAKRWCGITNRTNTSYDVKELGWNYYMNEFSAAIGIVQLKKLDKLNRIRKNIAKKYHSKINLEEKMPHNKESSFHLYWILVKNRSQFMKNLAKEGIETGIHYQPVHSMTLFKNHEKLPITENAGKHIVSIPIHPNIKESEIERIIYLINKFA